MNKTIIILWAAVAGAVAILGMLYFVNAQKRAFCPYQTQVSPNAEFGGAFTAIRHDGIAVTDKDVIDGPTLIYFGYTYCPDVCPYDTARNAQAVELAKANGISIKPVFATVDPERDTAQVLSEYLNYIHEDYVGLTGTADQIEHLKNIYKVYGQKAESDDPEYYLVDHSVHSYLVNPNGLIAIYDRSLSEDLIAENIMCHAENGNLSNN